ncbi:MAG: GIY-YIG nuclease family protein [Patescibacteria group bacterium]
MPAFLCFPPLKTHNNGAVRSTKPFRPWRVGYTEEYSTRTEARRRELFLKRTARARKDIFDSISDEGLIV